MDCRWTSSYSEWIMYWHASEKFSSGTYTFEQLKRWIRFLFFNNRLHYLSEPNFGGVYFRKVHGWGKDWNLELVWKIYVFNWWVCWYYAGVFRWWYAFYERLDAFECFRWTQQVVKSALFTKPVYPLGLLRVYKINFLF